MRWIKIAGSPGELNFQENNIAIVELEDRKLCVGKFNDSYIAFAYQCPHAGGILAEAHIDAMGNVVCPVHRYRYSMLNGRNVSGEGYHLKTWPVELRDDGVYIGTAAGGPFDLMFIP